MAEPFKTWFNRELVADMAAHLKRRWPGFDDAGFTDLALRNFDGLELKQRSNQIAGALVEHLPADAARALKLVTAVLRPLDRTGQPVADAATGLAGWAIWPLGEYVARAGVDHPDESLKALRALTIRSTAEFAIRPFLLRYPRKTLAALKAWTKDKNEHVRRLVSEGSRPRLPWGLRLAPLVADPAPILPLLAALRDDPSEYVRRSVANSLNDIGKDHPDLVAALAARWLKGASPERAKLVRHACRSLIKAGHTKTLAALGYSVRPKIKLVGFTLATPRVRYGAHAAFAVELLGLGTEPQQIVIDYLIHHRKKNGGTTAKVFKWRTLALKPRQTLRLERRHPIRPITTRVYYPGRHRVEVLINGKVCAGAEFELLM